MSKADIFAVFAVSSYIIIKLFFIILIIMGDTCMIGLRLEGALQNHFIQLMS